MATRTTGITTQRLGALARRSAMRKALVVALALAAVLTASVFPAGAEDPQAAKVGDSSAGDSKPAGRGLSYPGTLSGDPEDPANALPAIRERRTQRDSLLPVSPFHWAHELTGGWKKSLHDAIGLELGFAYTQLFQAVTPKLPGTDWWGTASDVDFMAGWDLLKRGEPTHGQLFVHLEGRWDWGTTAPLDLAPESLGSLTGTANSFGAYTPTFLPFRNLYWQHGSEEAGWGYRIGKITPDGLLATSNHNAPPLTFMSLSSGIFSVAVPDSGLGVVAAWRPNDRLRLLGLVSDANANRQDWGRIGEGDFFKAIELGFKIAPRTQKSGYSKLTLWHTDGTKDGEPGANGELGPDGWGFVLKLEQELTADGRAIGILKYGRSYNDSAFYKHQAGIQLLLYEPRLVHSRLENDLVGVAFNYVDPTLPGTRSEYNLEIFYRFPLFPGVDITLTYHSIFNPALDPSNDHASAFGLRFRTTF